MGILVAATSSSRSSSSSGSGGGERVRGAETAATSNEQYYFTPLMTNSFSGMSAVQVVGRCHKPMQYSGSTVAVQWQYSGSTVCWLYRWVDRHLCCGQWALDI
jgi:hypothetical protein